MASDHIAALLSTSPEQFERLQTYKGTIYVLLTTVLLFTLLNLYARRATTALNTVRSKQRELSILLHQRDQLIRELHHRVRNNMQIIIAILRLSEGGDDARRVSRIEMLAMIQDEIYSHPDPTAVDVSTVLRDVVRFLTPAAEKHHVKLEQTLATCHAPIDVVLNIGIAISELLDNTIRHAYPPGSEGPVRLELAIKAGTAYASIRDFGVGFPDTAPGDGTGITIARALAGQSGGTLDFLDPDPDTDGVRAEITFPVTNGLSESAGS